MQNSKSLFGSGGGGGGGGDGGYGGPFYIPSFGAGISTCG